MAQDEHDERDKYRPRTVAELFGILFGDPDMPGDRGRLGRIEESIAAQQRLLQAVFFAAVTATLALVVDLLVHAHIG